MYKFEISHLRHPESICDVTEHDLFESVSPRERTGLCCGNLGRLQGNAPAHEPKQLVQEMQHGGVVVLQLGGGYDERCGYKRREGTRRGNAPSAKRREDVIR